ncbi:MAG: hypothetical protein AAFP78_04110 [Pseudomonadota bacterium]
MGEEEFTELSGFDLGLIAVFFISWTALAVTQLAMLFGGRFVVFGVLCGIALVLAFALPLLATPEFCEGSRSIFACANGGRGLTMLALIWVAISAAMLGMFFVVLGIRRWKARNV